MFMWLISYLSYMFAFTNELFSFIIYMFLTVAFSFSLREVPLTFLIKLFWWYLPLSAFAHLQCLVSTPKLNENLAKYFWFQVFPFYQSEYIRPFWPAEFLLESQLIGFWEFPYM